jgi:uncharacterized protein (TIGR03084 family)
VISDLIAEGDDVDRMVAGLDAAQWALPTPAPGWTVAHQIAHLTTVSTLTRTAAADPEEFRAVTARVADDVDAAVDAALARHLGAQPDVLLAGWRAERAAAAQALGAVPPTETVPWLGGGRLPAPVVASVEIMELFGHGQDLADALGTRRTPTDRLEHLVTFAVRVRDFGYHAHGITPPGEPFRFEITAPSGRLWAYGPENATQKVTGPAHDFCLLVTRRRHPDDLAVTATGVEAERWLGIAQAYRGPAGTGRAAGQFTASRH